MVEVHTYDGTARLHKRLLAPGFSIMEILVVVLIIGILVSLVGPAGWRIYRMVQRQATTRTLNTLSHAIDAFQAELGSYPKQLEDLVERPQGPLGKKWKEPYLTKTKIPDDAWGRPYFYKVTPGGKHPYELYSYGPSGEDAPAEEYISAWDV